MTDNRALADRLARYNDVAAQGPWSVDAFDMVLAGEPDYSAMILGADGESILAQQISDADAQLIVSLRNNLPAILAALSRPNTASDELRALVAESDIIPEGEHACPGGMAEETLRNAASMRRRSRP